LLAAVDTVDFVFIYSELMTSVYQQNAHKGSGQRCRGCAARASLLLTPESTLGV